MPPNKLPLRVVRDCPVVGRPVLLSRDQVFVDCVLLSENQPTCSKLHACLGKYQDIKHIPECLLNNPSKHFPAERAGEQ